MFSIKNSEIHVLINQSILNKKYPHINISDFKKTTIKSVDSKLNLSVIDLGPLNDDFIENIEKLIRESSKTKSHKEKITAVPNYQTNKKENENCTICGNKISKVAFNSKIKSLKNNKPELCGKCIEKIVTAEFYDKVTPLIKSNDTKELNNVRERLGNDQLFDLGMELLEKYDIIGYIGVKKLFFTIDKDSYLITKYRKFSDKNNLLIDNICQVKNTAVKSHKKETISKEVNESQNNFINEKTTTLRKETLDKMNLFINALKAGKSHDDACKIAKLDADKIENWYKFGKKGDRNYIPFYNEYRPFRPENIKRNQKMEKFLEALSKDSFENALKKSNLNANKVRSWYSLGEKGDEDYKNFYFGCKLLLPKGIPKEDTGKIVNNEELMNEFITLIEDGKTNNEAINQLKIPKFKVKNWINQGKLGNKKYVDFYNAYMIEINEKKAAKKAKKPKKQQKESELTNDKICKICGRKFSKKRTKDICKRCEKKQYASKIILKLLKIIKPEIPFKKDDLKSLNLEEFQIKDYIWTLKEFNLITERNNKYQLKNKKTLRKFIEKSGIEIDELPSVESENSLHKTCKKCGKTLLKNTDFFKSETTPDGYEDNCKDCKKLISAADYLKEISEYIDFDGEFSEEDLKPYFKDPFKLQAKLWLLIENDLVKKNFEENTYVLTDEKTANDFLEKYWEEKPKIKPPVKNTKEEQMEIIINAMSEGKSRSEAAELAGTPLYKITHWFNEGRQGYGKDNIKFYKQLKEIETPQNALKIDMKVVLHELREGKDISQISHVSENEIKNWISKGKENLKPYDEFYREYEKIIQKNKEKDINEYNDKQINRKIFLENIKIGKSKQEAAENAHIDLSLVEKWYSKGFANEMPYHEFYEKYVQLKNQPKKAEIPQIEKTDNFGNGTTITQMNMILKNMVKGMDEYEAVENAEISKNTYKYWLNRGKQEFGELYTQFYHYINEIKDGKYIIQDDDPEDEYKGILTPLPKQLEKELKRFSKGNSTGFAWVNKPGNIWIYARRVGNQQISIKDENIYNLYKKVVGQGHVWGVRNLTKAKESLKSNLKPDKHEIDSGIHDSIPKEYHETNEKEEEIQNVISPEIYSPLPQKYLETFPKQSNQTGIAWVNKIGNQFIYSRKVNGKTVKITNYDIYKLHKEVITQNQIWGIRNYDNAQKFIDIPDAFEIPKIYKKPEEQINTDIYAPLSEEHISRFKPNMNNKSGIAWVNKVGNKWFYQRQKNGKIIRISDSNIRKLHERVLKNKQIWGIIDIEKAKISIENNGELPPNKTTTHITSKNATITYIKKQNKMDVLIKGIIKNNELISLLNKLKEFEGNIKRIITTAINKEMDLFIELELTNDSLERFEEKIDDLNWNINK